MKGFLSFYWRLGLIGLLWLGGVGKGILFLWGYAHTPGQAAQAMEAWPANSRLRLSSHRPTLVMMVHPHCPCSRASVGELEILMTRAHGSLEATVLFFKPSQGTFEGWEKTDLWQSASRTPGVTTLVDLDGLEAKRFGAMTSGQAFLYSPRGHLLFQGGITSARGHFGDNKGLDSVLQMVFSGHASQRKTAVFGCSLRNPERQAKPRSRPS